MCSTPKIPTPSVPAAAEPIAPPTVADAKVQKSASNTREQTVASAGKTVKTTSLGLTDSAQTKKKTLLGE